MEIKEAIRSALKELILPELDEIKQENREIKALLSITNKRLDDVNLHLADQSRRIDDTNKRIDDTNKRIDAIREELTRHIEAVREELTQHIESIREELTRRIDSVREELTRRIDFPSMRTSSTAAMRPTRGCIGSMRSLCERMSMSWLQSGWPSWNGRSVS